MPMGIDVFVPQITHLLSVIDSLKRPKFALTTRVAISLRRKSGLRSVRWAARRAAQLASVAPPEGTEIQPDEQRLGRDQALPTEWISVQRPTAFEPAVTCSRGAIRMSS
jgi:hypothetical protein